MGYVDRASSASALRHKQSSRIYRAGSADSETKAEFKSSTACCRTAPTGNAPGDLVVRCSNGWALGHCCPCGDGKVVDRNKLTSKSHSGA